jgi:hypothetical protein
MAPHFFVGGWIRLQQPIRSATAFVLLAPKALIQVLENFCVHTTVRTLYHRLLCIIESLVTGKGCIVMFPYNADTSNLERLSYIDGPSLSWAAPPYTDLLDSPNKAGTAKSFTQDMVPGFCTTISPRCSRLRSTTSGGLEEGRPRVPIVPYSP